MTQYKSRVVKRWVFLVYTFVKYNLIKKLVSGLYEGMDFESKTISTGVHVPICCSYTLMGAVHTVLGDFSPETSTLLLKQALRHIAEKTTIYTCYIHNLSYDGLFILEYLLTYKIKFEWLRIDGKIYYIRFFALGVYFEFRCLLRLLPFSLEKIGDRLGFRKMPFPYKILHKDAGVFCDRLLVGIDDFNSAEDYAQFLKENSSSYINVADYIQKYCENDTTLLQKAANMYWDTINQHLTNKLGKFVYSASGLSLQFYIKKYNKIELYLNHEVRDYVRNAYYGGRCEVFGNLRKDELGYYFDYPSMYSNVLKTHLPAGGYYFSRPPKIQGPGFYKITYQHESYMPVLPVRQDKLYFPTGTHTGTY